MLNQRSFASNDTLTQNRWCRRRTLTTLRIVCIGGKCIFFLKGIVLSLLVLLPLWTARAHAPSDTFLSFTLTETNVSGRWQISLRDLQHALGLDKMGPAAISPAVLRLREQALAMDTFGGMELRLDGQKKTLLRVQDEEWVTRPDGDALMLSFDSEPLAERPSRFDLNAQILFALEPQLRCIVRVEYWREPQQSVLTAGHPLLSIPLGTPPSKAKQLVAFVREGIGHIWTGYDHILFLIALLLPAVLTWQEKSWHQAVAFPPVVINVLKIITAFTIAHSVTLALASLHIVTLPTRLVESIIAGSVIIAAANNLVPLFRERGWMVAFGFGLIHGFGFANALDEAGLTKGGLAMALIGFNVGVELGQLAVVSIFVPLAYQFRNTAVYRNVALRGGSVAVMAVAAIWMSERIFNFKALPF